MTPAVPGTTLATAFDPRRNALNLLRLVLATAVIFGHAALLGGYVLPEPVMLTLSEMAVDGFFAISGFLLTRSWLNQPDWRRYLWHRSLRILPAFWVCLIVTAGVLAPVGWALRGESLAGYWTAPDGPFGYLWRNAALWISQPGISGTPDWSGYPGYWNGSLWSLYWEFLCYLALAVLGTLGVLRRRRRWVLVAVVACWLVTVAKEVWPGVEAAYVTSFNSSVVLRLGLMFLIGSVLYLYAEQVPMDRIFAAAAALLLLAGLVSGLDLRVLSGLPLAYLLLWLGCRLPSRLGLRTDLSYGMYIYAFPLQQVLFAAGAATIGWLGYAALATLVTVPVAFLSWHLVERPSLVLKTRGPGARGARAVAPAPDVAVLVTVMALTLFGAVAWLVPVR